MNEKINELIEYYITLRREDPANENEVYKWYAIAHFQQYWDINATDFYEMFKEAFKKRGNLVYQNSFSFLDALGKYFPEQLRNLFIIVYSFDDFYFNTRQKIIRYLTKELKFFILEFLIYHNYDSKKEYQLRKQKYKFIIYIPNVFFRQI